MILASPELKDALAARDAAQARVESMAVLELPRRAREALRKAAPGRDPVLVEFYFDEGGWISNCYVQFADGGFEDDLTDALEPVAHLVWEIYRSDYTLDLTH